MEDFIIKKSNVAKFINEKSNEIMSVYKYVDYECTVKKRLFKEELFSLFPNVRDRLNNYYKKKSAAKSYFSYYNRRRIRR